MRITDIAERARAYGLPSQRIDGMDVVAVYTSAVEAVSRARQKGGPSFLEYTTYRYMGHSRGDPGGYREKREVEQWHERDPIARFRTVLLDEFGADLQALEEIELQAQTEVETAVEFARNSPEPEPRETLRHVFAGNES
jgi:TPP-dependent pyruvate/acetoin dehydrogenase alpha subunit